MNFEHWHPIKRNTNVYLHDLEAYVEEFIPWHIRSGHEPGLVLSAEDVELMQAAAERMARRMITGVAATNATSWRAAAAASLKGRRIFEALRNELNSPLGQHFDHLIAENARLIRSLPADLALRTAAYVAREQQRGTRAATIAEELRRKVPQLIESRVKMLARTEVGRAETAIMRVRAERLGLDWYDWETSHDSRVRLSHKEMAKVLVAWNDPPAPEQLAGERSKLDHYHAGSTFNCRCLALPLIDLNEISWPHKVYSQGRIERVTRAEFERWIRGSRAA